MIKFYKKIKKMNKMLFLLVNYSHSLIKYFFIKILLTFSDVIV